jgi:hypothetical protein
VGALVVVELVVGGDRGGQRGPVVGQLAPQLLDLDRAEEALDDAVGLRAVDPGADVRELGPRGDVAGKARRAVGRAVVGDHDHRDDLAALGVGDVVKQWAAEQIVRG